MDENLKIIRERQYILQKCFFVNDTAGNLLTMGLAASKDLHPEEPSSTPGIPFGHYDLVFLGIGILMLLIVQIKRRKYRFNIKF